MDVSFGILLVTLATIAGVWYLHSRAKPTPRAFWAFLLYGVGAPNYAASLTKTNLFFSGLRSITWGLIFLSVWVVNGHVMAELYGFVDPHVFFLTVMFLSTLFSAMAFVEGLYLLARSVLRRKDHAPPSIQG